MASTFKNKTHRGIGTSPTTVGSYTVPASTQTTVIGLSLCNTTVSAITASVILNDGTNNTYIVKDASIPVGSTLVPVGGDQKVVLMTNDKINVVSSTASSVDVVMSILELT